MKYKIWFAATHTLSNTEKRKLFEYYKNYEVIYGLSYEELRRKDLVKLEHLQAFMKEKEKTDIDDLFAYTKTKDIKVTCYFDDDFPEKLKHIHDIPFQLFYIGRLPQKEEKLISMVGTRHCSGYGKSMTLNFSKELSERGFSIVSGLASGIDAHAHTGALEVGGVTYGILGCGADVCYPTKNFKLYQSMIETGGVLSEFGPKVMPRPDFFPRRNRIISGLSDVVLVMEAKEKSGSLITAEFALEQGKDIFALPGRVSDPLSFGTNKIISQGAGIIVTLEQLLSDINDLKDWTFDPMTFCSAKKLNLEKEESLVYSCFDFNSKSIDEVAKECNMDLMNLIPIIFRLCDLGLIEESFMNQYIRV